MLRLLRTYAGCPRFQLGWFIAEVDSGDYIHMGDYPLRSPFVAGVQVADNSEEIRGARAKITEARDGTQPTGVIDIEDVDFLKTPELRRAIHAREGGRCFYCLRQIPARLACIDHVVPRARVGCNSYRNLVSCCMECNSEKGERSAEEFLRWLFREHRLGAAELKDRFRKLELLAAGKLRPEMKN